MLSKTALIPASGFDAPILTGKRLQIDDPHTSAAARLHSALPWIAVYEPWSACRGKKA
jgi:hypothetical protein